MELRLSSKKPILDIFLKLVKQNVSLSFINL